jgi:hypothetical protein
VIKFVASGGG